MLRRLWRWIGRLMAKRTQGAPVITSGPWQGVNDATDPFENRQNFLYDAVNCYVPDPDRGSGVYARPGFQLLNSGAQLGTTGTRYVQCIYDHKLADGTLKHYVFAGGKMYSWNGTTTFTDVTPAGVTINSGSAVPIYCASLAGTLIVNDTVNQPWRFDGTTAHLIYVDGTSAGVGSSTWVAAGPPVIYDAKVFFIQQQLGATYDQRTIIWSEENDASLGYQQTNYDDAWTLTQTNADFLRCLAATELALYVFRPDSITAITGRVNADFASSGTRDAVSTKVGCMAASSVVVADNTIFFADRMGYPWMLPIGGKPVPIWQQLRRAGDAHATPTAITDSLTKATACYFSTRNMVLLGSWSGDADGIVGNQGIVRLYAFHAETGAYMGYWTLASNAMIAQIGVVRTTAVHLLVGGGSGDGSTAADSQGYIWRLSLLTENSWTDNATNPSVSATVRMLVSEGYQEYNFGDPVAITASAAPCTLTYTVPRGAVSLSAATPTSSTDGSYRCQWGTQNCIGREARMQVSPTTFTAQWGLHSLATVVRPTGANTLMP